MECICDTCKHLITSAGEAEGEIIADCEFGFPKEEWARRNLRAFCAGGRSPHLPCPVRGVRERTHSFHRAG